MKLAVQILSGITIIATILSGLIIYGGMKQAESAVQEAVACTLAVAVTVLPYVLTRCLEIIKEA